MVRRRLLGLGLPLPARGPVYTLGCGPGARSVCQGYLGVIRPSSAGQTPKDVVVGAAAAWEGPWVWRGRRVGSPRTQLPLGVPGPSEGAAAGPPAPTHSPLEPLPQPQFELCLDSQEGCGGRKGPGGHSKSGRSGRQAATPTVGRGQEPNPGGGAGHALIHPARGQRQAGQAQPNPGQACVSGRKGQGAQPGTEHQQRWGWARPPASAVGTLALPPHRASEGNDVERTCGLLSPVFPALAAPRWGRPSGPALPGTGHPA